MEGGPGRGRAPAARSTSTVGRAAATSARRRAHTASSALRVVLVEIAPDDHALLLAMHHVIRCAAWHAFAATSCANGMLCAEALCCWHMITAH